MPGPWRNTATRLNRTEEILLPENTAHLIVLVGESERRVFVLEREAVIGRDEEADVCVLGNDVSRAHARIQLLPTGHFVIEDLGSRNGTRVNGEPVTRHDLRFGDRIQIGSGTILMFTPHNPLEGQLQQLQKLESLGQLAGGVAHDFNNLLGVVIANLTYLLDMAGDARLSEEEVREAITDASAAARRGVDLTRQLLGFARRGNYDERPTDVSELIAEVLRFVGRTLDRSIDIESAIEPALIVHGDRTQLQQVLMNLCLNARDALGEMPDGSLRVTADRLRVGPDPSPKLALLAPGLYARVRVRDNGAGMDQQTQARVFEPFFTTKGPDRGTGLGLATVYGIVQNHRGHVHVESHVGQGTTFDVYLPLSDAVTGDRTMDLTGHSALSDVAAAGSQDVVGGGSILVVDDEKAVRRSTRRLLIGLGYDVVGAEDGLEAVEIYRERGAEFRLVLLDLIMPRLGGEGAFRRLKELDPNVRVLLTSGHSEESTTRAMLEAGALGFLQKPFDVNGLRAAMRAAIARN